MHSTYDRRGCILCRFPTAGGSDSRELHTHTCIHIHAYVHAHSIRAYLQVRDYMRTYMHTHTCIHIHAYTYLQVRDYMRLSRELRKKASCQTRVDLP